ncbi:MAG: sulfite exporter TauE/SafE family protein [Clostridia bacterium]|nr:sulfite exporter TauE/SafE family protein [Clostridia bacterium]
MGSKTGNTILNNTQKIVCGVAVGSANSIFGGGGGMLAVPLLMRIGLSEKRAHATAILVILPVSLLSFILYAYKGLYDFSVLIPTALGVTAGGVLGANLLGKLPTKTVNFVFGCLQVAAGIFLLT